MSKPEWGVKRICTGCGARYYDLRRNPPTCPKCGAVHAGKPSGRRRVAPPVPEKEEKPPKPKVRPDTAETDDDIDEIEDIDSEVDDDEVGDDDDSLIEDTSDLGEDDDDMSEVIERIDDDDNT